MNSTGARQRASHDLSERACQQQILYAVRQFLLFSRAVCSPYSTLNLRWPSFSSRCRSDLEESSAARHVRAVTSRLLHSLEEFFELCYS